MSEFFKIKSNGQWDILEKAKFISPEQQKQNRAKSTDQANKDALKQAKINTKDSPKKEEQPKTEQSKKISHLTVIKEEDLVEKMCLEKNGQWSLKKWNMEKRCWEGYEPTPGKKAYQEDSCRPIKKEELEVAPEGSKNRKTYKESFKKSKDISGDELDSSMMIGDLQSIKKHADEIMSKIDRKDVAPDWVKSKITESAAHLSTVADFVSGLQKSIADDEIEVIEWDNGDIDINFGNNISENYINSFCKSLCEKGNLEKKEWSPKAEHKSDKGGLTEAGRKSYNKATGGNLKAPQPGGGPRKKSFCARNKGQINMHNIDCKKDPDKRACKARRRWKCTN